MKKFRTSFDKIKESHYHFENLLEISERIKIETNYLILAQLTKKFRYELNSYVNSHRATTFNIQKECRAKYGEKFESLYSNLLSEILEDEFLIVIKELRNINQKEGNIYPTFIFKSVKDDLEINFESDLNTYESNKLLSLYSGKQNKKQEINNTSLENIVGTSKFKETYNFSDEDIETILEGAAEMLKFQLQKFDDTAVYELKYIVIERINKKYELEEFLDNLRRVGKKLFNLYKKIEENL